MPWLAEILEDETIPEEDRYWLDCRVRAVIAQDLHLFYDREGNPVHIEADWITPGEDYWRENFIVNPEGEPFLYDSPDRPTNVVSEPGLLVNQFGEEIGQLAIANQGIRLSRDGSIGVTLSGRHPLPDCPVQDTSQLCFACLLFPDGTFKEIPIGFAGYTNFAVSNDATTIAVSSYVPEYFPEKGEYGGLLSILNGKGELLHQYFMTNPPSCPPAVSANGRFIACQQFPVGNSGAFLLDGNSGEVLHEFGEDILGHYFFFTPNEKYLCVGGLQRPLVFDCDLLEDIWTLNTIDALYKEYRIIYCDNSAQRVTMQTFLKPSLDFGTYICSISDNYPVSSELQPDDIQIPPQGYFTLSQSYNTTRPHFSFNGFLCTPLLVNRLLGGGCSLHH